MRRRVVAAAAALALAIVALSGWGFVKLHQSLLAHDPSVVPATFSALVITLAYMFSVSLAVGGAFLGAPAIASDVDSGLLLAILPRPIRRADVVLGKWLALCVLLAAFSFTFGGLELTVIRVISGYAPPHPLTALALLAFVGIATATLALALGTRFSPIAAGVVVVALFGFAWISGVAVTIAAAFGNATLVHAGTVVALLMPTDALWRGALTALEPAMLLAASATPQGGRLLGPFAGAPPPPAFLAWSVLWTLGVLAAAVAAFRTRDV